MKNIIFSAAALSSALFLASCATTGTGDNGPVKPYPLDKCLVMDVPLKKMGEPKKIVYQGQEMKFCCTRCVKAFKANPDFYFNKLAKETGAIPASTGEQSTAATPETAAPAT